MPEGLQNNEAEHMSREGEVCFGFVCFGGLKSGCSLFRTKDQGEKLCTASSGNICLLSDLLQKNHYFEWSYMASSSTSDIIIVIIHIKILAPMLAPKQLWTAIHSDKKLASGHLYHLSQTSKKCSNTRRSNSAIYCAKAKYPSHVSCLVTS